MAVTWIFLKSCEHFQIEVYLWFTQITQSDKVRNSARRENVFLLWINSRTSSKKWSIQHLYIDVSRCASYQQVYLLPTDKSCSNRCVLCQQMRHQVCHPLKHNTSHNIHWSTHPLKYSSIEVLIHWSTYPLKYLF